MAPKKKGSAAGESSGSSQSPLKILLDQASDLDFTSSSSSPSESLLKPNFEISKLFQIMDFALANSSISQTGEDGNPLFEGLDLSPREELMKKVNVFYEFEVRNAEGDREAWWVDMKKSGRIYNGKCPVKPDVSIKVSDKDLVALMTGQASPQKMFLTGRLKVRGNLMAGLRGNDVMSSEVAKLSKL